MPQKFSVLGSLLGAFFILILHFSAPVSGEDGGLAPKPQISSRATESTCDQTLNQWIPVGPGFAPIDEIQFDSSNSGVVYALGSTEPPNQHAAVYRSDDAGDSWERLHLNSSIEAAGLLAVGDHLLLAAETQGLLESFDGGLTWHRNGNFELVEGIWQSSVDSRELWLYDRHSGGLFRSQDQGSSWMPVTAPSCCAQYFDVIHVGESVYIYTPSGTYRSSDSGESWEEWEIPDPDNPGEILNISNVYFRSGTTYVIMPAEYFSSSGFTGAGLYRSTDGGDTWKKILGGRDSDFIGYNAISGLAIDPLDAEHLLVSTNYGVYESADRGDTWSRPSLGHHQPAIQGLQYVSTVRFDPSVPTRLFTALYNQDAGIFRSQDSGSSWAAVTRGVRGPVDDFAVTPEGTILVGNSGGIYEGSPSASESIEIWDWTTSSANHRWGTEFLYQSRQTPDLILAEDGDGEFFYSPDGGLTWHYDVEGLPTEETLSIAEAPGGSGKIYLAKGADYRIEAEATDGLYVSQDAARSWEKVSSGPIADGTTLTIQSLAISSTNALEIYAATSNGLFGSSDGGQTWNSDSLGVPEGPWGNPVTNFRGIYIHPEDDQVLFAVAPNTLFKSSDGGESWKITLSDVGVIQPLVFLPGKPDQIWLLANNVYASEDGGLTWTEYPLPDSFFESLGVMESETTQILAGGSSGLWMLEPGPENLYFPIYDDPEGAFVGFAASNYSGAPKRLDFEARDRQGDLLSLGSNPTTRELSGRHQIARQGHELLGKSGALDTEAWLQIQSDAPGLGSFFQTGDNQLKWLDGAIAQTHPHRLLYFTRVYSGDTAFRGFSVETFFHLANPGTSAAQLEIRLLGGTGVRSGFRQAPISRTISARGVLRVSARELFGNAFEGAGKVVEVKVTEGCGVIGLQEVRLPDAETLFMLNAQPFNEENRLYSSQLASLPDVMYTSLKLFNASRWSRTIEVVPFDDEGNELSDPQELVLAPGESFEKDCRILFSFSDSAIGSLLIRGEGYGVIGDVVFGDPVAQKFAAALALQTKPFTRAVFSQVANVGDFFTGLALMSVAYENSWEDYVTIRVYDSEGNETGRNMVPLQPGGRRSQLLKEFVPATSQQIGGYVMIESYEPIIAQQLFGTNRLSVLAAVPPKIVRAVHSSSLQTYALENSAGEPRGQEK